MADLSRAVWRKSSRSGLDGCVEVAFLADGGVAVRDSKDRAGPALTFSSMEWKAFVAGANAGEFDHACTMSRDTTLAEAEGFEPGVTPPSSPRPGG